MNRSKLKLYLAGIPLVALLFGIFIRYVPWLFGSKPINQIGEHNLSNTPPPDGAISFAINHGKAIYYFEPTPSETPIQTACVVIAFFVCIACLGYIAKKLEALRNDT